MPIDDNVNPDPDASDMESPAPAEGEDAATDGAPPDDSTGD